MTAASAIEWIQSELVKPAINSISVSVDDARGSEYGKFIMGLNPQGSWTVTHTTDSWEVTTDNPIEFLTSIL